MTEVEKLARTARYIILNIVGLALAAGLFVVGSAGVRWGWDAATTSRDERMTACAEKAAERTPKHGALSFLLIPEKRACEQTDGDVNEAVKLVENG